MRQAEKQDALRRTRTFLAKPVRRYFGIEFQALEPDFVAVAGGDPYPQMAHAASEIGLLAPEALVIRSAWRLMRRSMARRLIGQERLEFAAATGSSASALEEISGLIEWSEIDGLLVSVHAAAKGEAAWPPLAMVKALLLSIWYDLWAVKLAEALDDRASFRRFCGFSKTEATPERTAFVRFRRALIASGLDEHLFALVTAQLSAKAITIKTGTIVDATIIASASKEDGEAR